jgi:hypothetical protein
MKTVTIPLEDYETLVYKAKPYYAYLTSAYDGVIVCESKDELITEMENKIKDLQKMKDKFQLEAASSREKIKYIECSSIKLMIYSAIAGMTLAFIFGQLIF